MRTYVHSMMKLGVSAALAFMLLLTAVTPAANAAMFELPVTIKAAFDKMSAAADQPTAAKLRSGYESLLAIQKQDSDWDDKINKLHYSNEEKLLVVRQRLKEMDAAKLTKLAEEVTKMEEKYKNLFAFHSSLTKQLSLAKSAKNKTLASVLQSQVDVSKIAVTLAKEDIKKKKAALAEAKAVVAKNTKAIKTTLSEIDKLKVNIRSAKSSITSTKKQFTSETNNLKTAVRGNDATNSIKSLTRLSGFVEAIITQKKKVFSLEEQIAVVIAKANAQF